MLATLLGVRRYCTANSLRLRLYDLARLQNVPLDDATAAPMLQFQSTPTDSRRHWLHVALAYPHACVRQPLDYRSL